MKTINETSQILLNKFPALGKLIDANPSNSYKAIEPHVNGNVLRSYGQHMNCFVKKNDVIWSIINTHNGVEDNQLLGSF